MVEFARNLANFAAANGKKHVVVLSSLEFGRWQSIDMSRYQHKSFLSKHIFLLSLCASMIETL